MNATLLALLGLAWQPYLRPISTPTVHYLRPGFSCPAKSPCLSILECTTYRARNGSETASLRPEWPQTCGYSGVTPRVCCPQHSRQQTTKASYGANSDQPVSSSGEDMGDSAVGESKWPWLAVFGTWSDGELGGWFCGGALISCRHVLTVARCLPPDRDPAAIGVRLGDSDLNHHQASTFIQQRNVSRVETHEDEHHEIALVTLDRPVSVGHFDTAETAVRPICLPSVRYHYYGRSAVLAGWLTLSEQEDQSSSEQDALTEESGSGLGDDGSGGAPLLFENTPDGILLDEEVVGEDKHFSPHEVPMRVLHCKIAYGGNSTFLKNLPDRKLGDKVCALGSQRQPYDIIRSFGWPLMVRKRHKVKRFAPGVLIRPPVRVPVFRPVQNVRPAQNVRPVQAVRPVVVARPGPALVQRPGLRTRFVPLKPPKRPPPPFPVPPWRPPAIHNRRNKTAHSQDTGHDAEAHAQYHPHHHVEDDCKEQYELVGLISRAGPAVQGRDNKAFAGVFTKVSDHVPWIQQRVN